MQDDAAVRRVVVVPVSAPVTWPQMDFDSATQQWTVIEHEQRILKIRPMASQPVTAKDDTQRPAVGRAQRLMPHPCGADNDRSMMVLPAHGSMPAPTRSRAAVQPLSR